MAKPVLFLSASTRDLKAWRDHLHDAFSRARFEVRTQEKSLRAEAKEVDRRVAAHDRTAEGK